MGGKRVQSKSLSFLRTFPFLLPSLRTFELGFVCIFVAKKIRTRALLLRYIFPHLAISYCRLRKKKKSILFVFVFFFFLFCWVLFSWPIVAAGEEFWSCRSLLATHKLLLEAKQSAAAEVTNYKPHFFFSFFSFGFFLFLLLFFRL
jgi:hypothetical protein